ncbi:MAG TPA: hypothetical protein VIH17_03620 [Candidatus Acidoferrales bacterium]
MQVTLKTRKPADHLAASDLSTFPVWEFALDEEGIEGRDETWVRPLNTQLVRRGEYSLQVAADFKAACGRAYSGFVTVTTAEEPVEISGGVVLLGSDHLPIPSPGMFGFQEVREGLLSRLGLSESELFPITYTLRVLIEGEQVLRTGVLIRAA